MIITEEGRARYTSPSLDTFLVSSAVDGSGESR
jgi:hypothetical protein